MRSAATSDETGGIMWICSGGNYRLHEISVGIFGVFLFIFVFPNCAPCKTYHRGDNAEIVTTK